MLFSSYQTQNLGFAFSKCAFCHPNGIPNGHIVNEEDQIIEQPNNDLINWNIPRINENEVYRTSSVQSTFKAEYKVKIVERACTLSKNKEHCSLFNKQVIKRFKEKDYKYIHTGLVQVAIKPLTRKGINASVLLILKDARFKVFEPSLLRIVEASLYNAQSISIASQTLP